MSTEQSQKLDNFDCFEGTELAYWRAFASGFRPVREQTGPAGALLEMDIDIDGYVVQNGGMHTPQVTKLRPGSYFRFFGTKGKFQYGTESSMSGGWWIDYENMVKIQDFAIEQNVSLARAAQRLLVIPGEWSDCGYLGKARLTTVLKAFVGKGKPATGSVSPDSAERRAGNIAVSMSPKHLEMKQYFVPGARPLIKQAFGIVWAKPVVSISEIRLD